MTTNQTAPVTDEELDQMILKLERDGMTPKQLSLMKELREVRRAKGGAVVWDYEWASCITCEGPQDFKRIIEREAPPEWAIEEGQARNIIPLYTVPPAPVVPDELTREEYKRRFMADDCFDNTFRGGWNACRAATLNHSGDTADMDEPVSNRDELNSPETPDCWIPVSERMPPEGEYVSVVSLHGEYVSGLVGGEWLELHDGTSFGLDEIVLWMMLPSLPEAPMDVHSAFGLAMARYGDAMQKLADGGD